MPELNDLPTFDSLSNPNQKSPVSSGVLQRGLVVALFLLLTVGLFWIGVYYFPLLKQQFSKDSTRESSPSAYADPDAAFNEFEKSNQVKGLGTQDKNKKVSQQDFLAFVKGNGMKTADATITKVYGDKFEISWGSNTYSLIWAPKEVIDQETLGDRFLVYVKVNDTKLNRSFLDSTDVGKKVNLRYVDVGVSEINKAALLVVYE